MSKLNSLRRCILCEKNTIFQYNRTTGHSQCKECGSGWAMPIDDMIIMKENIIKKIRERKEQLIVVAQGLKKGATKTTVKGRIKETETIIGIINQMKFPKGKK